MGSWARTSTERRHDNLVASDPCRLSDACGKRLEEDVQPLQSAATLVYPWNRGELDAGSKELGTHERLLLDPLSRMPAD